MGKVIDFESTRLLRRRPPSLQFFRFLAVPPWRLGVLAFNLAFGQRKRVR